MATLAAQYPSTRHVLRLFGTWFGPTVLAIFVYVLWNNQQSVNIASFTLYATLDFVFFISMLKAGARKDAFVAGLYGLVASLAVAVIYRNGAWSWGIVEWCTSACIVAALLGWWRTGNPVTAIVLSAVAVTIATLPIAIDAWFYDMRWTWWLWVATMSGGVAMVIARESNRLESWLFNAIGATLNGTVLLIIFLR